MIGKRTLYYNKIDLNNGKVERKKRIYGNDDENMKVVLEVIKEKEKKYPILLMVIRKCEII